MDIQNTDFTNPQNQAVIAAWIEQLKNDLGSKEKWAEMCQIADWELSSRPVDLVKVLDAFEPYTSLLPPGHDRGHLLRDLLNSVILYDGINAKYRSDKMAGLLAGAFHDIGNSLVARYKDRQYGAGHAEMGAYLFDRVTADLGLGLHLRSLTAYAIAAHTHYLKEMAVEIPPGYSRTPYWDDLWKEGEVMCGVAVRMTRMADRLDTNGITLLVRHLLSRCDQTQEGGADISGGEWVQLNRESLTAVFSPHIRDPFGKPPTSFEHVLNFRNSNFGNSVYSRDDFQFPVFERILMYKFEQLDQVIKGLDDQSVQAMDRSDIERCLHRISLSPADRFETNLHIFRQEWDQLSPEDRQRWGRAFTILDMQYSRLLNYYRQLTEGSSLGEMALSRLS